MLHKTNGIILHTTGYSDSSIIVKAYTDQFGIQSYLINGVRGKKAKNKASLFQPMALVEMVVSATEKNKLQRVSEITVRHPYSCIPYDISKSSIIMFLNEVLYRSLKEQHADEGLYEYIKNALLILDLKAESCSNFHLYFLVQLSRFLGFYPQGNYNGHTSFFDLPEGRFISTPPLHMHYLEPDESKLLSDLINSSYENIHLLNIERAPRKKLLQNLVKYYQLHISSFGEIRSIAVLEEVIS